MSDSQEFIVTKQKKRLLDGFMCCSNLIIYLICKADWGTQLLPSR